MLRLVGALLALFIFFSAHNAAYAACASPTGNAGAIVYSSSQKTFQYCNDSNWIGMNIPGSGSGGCTNPTLGEGKMVYNADFRVLQGCAGNAHRAMGPIGGGIGWKYVSSSFVHSCGIKQDDSLWCWGRNSSGVTGLGITAGNTLVPTAISAGGTWKSVAVAESHTCAIKSDDTLLCWGYNGYGSTGINNTTGNSLSPTQVNGGGSWKSVTSGMYQSCGIKSDDSVRCWGWNTNGQLGDNSTTQRNVPTALSGGGAWKSVFTTFSNTGVHTCGIKSDDSLWCWGSNSSGMLGDNSTTQRNIPTSVSGGGTWKSVWGGDAHTCGIKSDDSLWCWGNNSSSQLGDTTTTNSLVPLPVAAGGVWSNASTGYGHTCGIRLSGVLYCWGGNGSGQLGDNILSSLTVPREIYGGGTWNFIATGSNHTCGIKNNNSLYCWGWNGSQQLGDNTSTNRLIPTAVSGGGSWGKVSLGYSHSCGIKLDDSMWCWGANNYGMLGDNSTTARGVPTSVSGGGAWKYIHLSGSNFYSHSCGIKSDDTLWCWGHNNNGELGDSTTTQRQVPTAVSGGGTWKKVSAGASFFPYSCGIKSDDTLWCWGDNSSGQLGDGTTTQRLVPTAISGGGAWIDVAASNQYTCGIKTDGSAWCWGAGMNTPTAVAIGSLWKTLSSSRSNNCGLKTDDTYWCWNLAGIASSTIPTMKWETISASSHTCGTVSGGTVLCWGSNSFGQITATEYSTPYQTQPVLPLCGSPTGKPGQIAYNSTAAMLQYCDGSGWVSMGGFSTAP